MILEEGMKSVSKMIAIRTSLAYDNNIQRQRRRRLLGFAFVVMTLTTGICNAIFTIGYKNFKSQAELESRYPLNSRTTVSDNNVRYLSFGSSNAYGLGLDRPLKQAYPYLLSKSTHNVAVQSGDLTLAAACTQSVVHDHIYDVITIEFVNFDATTLVLVKRLRQRFPNANIILVQLWQPSHIRYEISPNKYINLHEFRKANGNLSLHSKDLYVEMLDAGPERWSLHVPTSEYLQQVLPAARTSFIALAKLPEDAFLYPQTLHQLMQTFQANSDHLSEAGHLKLAQGIQNLIKNMNILDRKDRNQVGSWGFGDQCELWYTNGRINRHASTTAIATQLRQSLVSLSTPSSSSAKLIEFGSSIYRHKHAMLVTNTGIDLQVTNNFDSERMLYLTYMTSPNVENDDDTALPTFPRTQINVNNQRSVMLGPLHENKVPKNSKEQYLTRTSAVGLVFPGKNTIQIIPTEASQHSFYLVGVCLLSPEMSTLPTEFSLEVDSTALSHSSYWKMW